MIETESTQGHWAPCMDPKVLLALGAAPYQVKAWETMPEYMKVAALAECLFVADPAGYA